MKTNKKNISSPSLSEQYRKDVTEEVRDATARLEKTIGYLYSAVRKQGEQIEAMEERLKRSEKENENTSDALGRHSHNMGYVYYPEYLRG